MTIYTTGPHIISLVAFGNDFSSFSHCHFGHRDCLKDFSDHCTQLKQNTKTPTETWIGLYTETQWEHVITQPNSFKDSKSFNRFLSSSCLLPLLHHARAGHHRGKRRQDGGEGRCCQLEPPGPPLVDFPGRRPAQMDRWTTKVLLLYFP